MSASWKDVIDRLEKRKEATYHACYRCTNCGKEDNLQIAKGTLAPKKATCPRCECRTMIKVKVKP